MKSPIETLFVIAEAKQNKDILEVLTENNMFGKFVMGGKGTAKSKVEDIFGFGIIDKDVVVSFVDTKKSQTVCEQLNELINKNGHQGIVFTVPVDAISSDLFRFIMGGQNE